MLFDKKESLMNLSLLIFVYVVIRIVETLVGYNHEKDDRSELIARP